MQEYNRSIQFLIEPVDKSSPFLPLFAGHEDCISGHRFGPHIRDHYLIHFCRKGSGTITDRLGTHAVRQGDMFIIRPGEVTVYTADSERPWCYCWIGFDGSRAAVFDAEQTVYRCPEELMEKIRGLCEAGETSADIYISALYELVYRLFTKGTPKKQLLSAAEKYVEYNYYRNDLSIEEIASVCGYERSYLYRLFKEKRGVGIKEFIVSRRMSHARQFLLDGHSVKATSERVGYADQFSFSRAYKKYFGVSPSKAKDRA